MVFICAAMLKWVVIVTIGGIQYYPTSDRLSVPVRNQDKPFGLFASANLFAASA
jgi:hypothetical protein